MPRDHDIPGAERKPNHARGGIVFDNRSLVPQAEAVLRAIAKKLGRLIEHADQAKSHPRRQRRQTDTDFGRNRRQQQVLQAIREQGLKLNLLPRLPEMITLLSGGLNLSRSITPIAKMIVASLVMGLACIAVRHIPHYPTGHSKTAWAMQLLILMTTGGVVYIGACAAMGINVLEHVRRPRPTAN